MQRRSICVFVAALAVSTAFASQSSGSVAGKVTTMKDTPTAPLGGVLKAPSMASAIRINPPLPPIYIHPGIKLARTGGDPPTVIVRS